MSKGDQITRREQCSETAAVGSFARDPSDLFFRGVYVQISEKEPRWELIPTFVCRIILREARKKGSSISSRLLRFHALSLACEAPGHSKSSSLFLIV